MATAAKFPAALLALADVFGEMPNFPPLTLNGAINSSVTSIVVNEAIPATWPTLSWLTIDSEIMRVTSYNAGTKTFTVAARDGSAGNSQSTTAASHVSGAYAFVALTAQQWNQIVAEVIAIETGPLRPADGSVGTPAFSFMSDTDTGIFRTGSNDMSLVTGGTDRLRINTSGEIGLGIAPASTIRLKVSGTIQTTGTIAVLNGAADSNVLLTNSGGSGIATFAVAAANGMTVDGIMTVGPGAAGGKVILTGTITAGGLLANGLQVGTSGPLVYSGSGAPSISAAVKGSLYLRTDGTTTNDRIYVAKDTAGAWASLTSAS